MWQSAACDGSSGSTTRTGRPRERRPSTASRTMPPNSGSPRMQRFTGASGASNASAGQSTYREKLNR